MTLEPITHGEFLFDGCLKKTLDKHLLDLLYFVYLHWTGWWKSKSKCPLATLWFNPPFFLLNYVKGMFYLYFKAAVRFGVKFQTWVTMWVYKYEFTIWCQVKLPSFFTFKFSIYMDVLVKCGVGLTQPFLSWMWLNINSLFPPI